MVRILIVLSAVLAVAFGDEDDKIVKGWLADIERFPFMLSIQLRGNHWCGGSIITANWALTAGHCMIFTADYFEIRAGSVELHFGGTLHQANLALTHPKYNETSDDYDCAIIHVIPGFPIGTTSCRPVKLADTEPDSLTHSYVAGWGRESYNKSGPVSHLLFTLVPIEDRKVCKYLHGSRFTSSMICAGFIKGGPDACKQDSGGPLISKGIQTGIVSWGVDCGQPVKMGVYTNVAVIKGWIKGMIADKLL